MRRVFQYRAAAVGDHLMGIRMQLNSRARDVVRSAGFVEGVIGSVCHLQRGEDVLLCIDIERLAAEFFHERSEGDEVDVGVFEGEAGWAVERGVHGAADAFGLVGRGESPGIFEGDVFGQAGVVGEELADGDFFFAIGGELGEVLRRRGRRTGACPPHRAA